MVYTDVQSHQEYFGSCPNMKIAIVRGKFLNQYEMQSFAPLADRCDITAYGSLTPFHDTFPFPVVKLPSPMDIADFPYKMPILNRIFTDAHLLIGLENHLRGFDIVHTAESYYRYTQQSLDAKKRGYVKKVIATVLENIPFNNEGIWGRKTYKKRFRHDIDHVIALTQKTKKAQVLEGMDEKKITVIGHGIDTSCFSPDPDHWKWLGTKKPTVHVLFSGRLEKYKGVFTILRAAKALTGNGAKRQYIFTFIGNGSEKSEMLSRIREWNLYDTVSIRSVSYDDMPGVYKTADIFVAPSISTPTYEEQYCTVLLEAQAMGLPIITTRSGGIPENVGDTALFIPEDDETALAKHLTTLAGSPSLRVKQGEKALRRAQTIHDSKKIASRIYSVYEKVLAG